MRSKSVASVTRKIYFKQHLNFAKDPVLLHRCVKMFSDPTYFSLTKKDFEGIHILDAGSGNSGFLEIAMIGLGAGHVTCLDIGKQWIPALRTLLKKYAPPEKFDFVDASTDKIPFPDNHFDMVFSQGVLMHLNNMEQTKRAWKELARVTKRGGYLYVSLGNPSGLLEDAVIPAVRKYYNTNKEFKHFIDTQNPDMWKGFLKSLSESMQKRTGEHFAYENIAPLLDWDFCTMLQNTIQCPHRYITQTDKDHVLAMYKQNKFKPPRRCRRFVVRHNIRKFFAPLHFGDVPYLSKLVYGPGCLEYIAQKR